MTTFDEKLKQEREKIISDKDITVLPLDTEADFRKALRVLLDALVEINARLETVEGKVDKK